MRTFYTVWAGQLVSLLGSGLTNFGLGVWVFQKTGSATLFSTIAFLAILPGILAAPVAGVMVDRWNRRLIMLASDCLSALIVGIVALIVISGNLQVWTVMVLAALTSAFAAFQVPAYQASVSTLVPKEQLGRAAGMVQMGQAVADLASPALGGSLYAVIGLRGLILFDFVSFFFGIATLAVTRFPKVQQHQGQHTKPSFRREFQEGWKFIRERRGLLLLLAYFAMLNLLLPMAGVLFAPLMLSFAGPKQFGIAASIIGLGMLVGSVVMSAWGGPKNRILGVLGSGLLLGLFLGMVGLRANLTWLAACGFLMMFVSPIVNGTSQAIWQAKTPLNLQGRVFSVRRMIAQGTAPLAMLMSGPIVDRVFSPAMMPGGSLTPYFGPLIGTGPGRGTGLLFIVMGALTVIGSAFAMVSPTMRTIDANVPDAPSEFVSA